MAHLKPTRLVLSLSIFASLVLMGLSLFIELAYSPEWPFSLTNVVLMSIFLVLISSIQLNIKNEQIKKINNELEYIKLELSNLKSVTQTETGKSDSSSVLSTSNNNRDDTSNKEKNTDNRPPLSIKPILVADDNPANLRLVSELLRDINAPHALARDGEEVLSMMESSLYSMILMDVHMPRMSGIEATKQIRINEQEQNTRIPIVAVTANTVAEKRHELLLAGFDDYLSKPLSEARLRQAISRWADKTDKCKQVNTKKEQNKSTSSLESKEIPPSVNSDILDPELAVQRANGNRELAYDMFKMLIDSLPKTEIDIASAFEKQDISGLFDHVHQLFGGTCYCGVPELQKASERLDKWLKENGEIPNALGEAAPLVNDLRDAINTLVQWCENKDLKQVFELKEAI